VSHLDDKTLDNGSPRRFAKQNEAAGADVYKKQHIIEQNGQWFDSFDYAQDRFACHLRTTEDRRRRTDDGRQKTEEWMTDDGRENIDEKQTTNVEHPT
jgi:hypothetical protein